MIFPGITASARYDSRGLSVKYDNNEPFAEQAYFTDQPFFEMFNFPVVAGTNNIKDKNTVLITERTATKYFGKQDPLGKSLVFYSGETYAMPLTVVGVLKDVPANSTIQFDFISNFDNLLKGDGSRIAGDDWTWFLDAAFFKIPNTADARRLSKEFNKYIPVQNKARPDWKTTGFSLIDLKQNAGLRNLSNNSFRERPDDSAAYGPLNTGHTDLPLCLS
ncbi:MAG: ABC transporter permease [Bacteroidota bacterium]